MNEPDSINQVGGGPPSGRTLFLKRTAPVWIPLLVVVAWFAYLWFTSGVITSLEKYPSGAIKAEGFLKRVDFSAYRRHGHWITYHPNGQQASEGRYDEGQKVGVWSYWDSEGRPTSQPSTPDDG